MRILYVLTQYPKLSETFVLQEIALLREMGHEVWACSFREPRASEADVIGQSGFWIAPRHVAPRSFKLALNALRHAGIPTADRMDGARGSRRERTPREADGRLALGHKAGIPRGASEHTRSNCRST